MSFFKKIYEWWRKMRKIPRFWPLMQISQMPQYLIFTVLLKSIFPATMTLLQEMPNSSNICTYQPTTQRKTNRTTCNGGLPLNISSLSSSSSSSSNKLIVERFGGGLETATACKKKVDANVRVKTSFHEFPRVSRDAHASTGHKKGWEQQSLLIFNLGH